MSTQLPEEQQIQQNKSNTSRIRYVEELAGEGDAWVSITDAARITRTSEAMARRWVTSGRIPIKRQAVGINQHTRLVRLSDVAAIRPIIDPTAAISDEVHTLDLPSIPRQHAQLMQDHKHLLQQVVAGQSTLEELSVQVREQKTTLEQSKQDYLEQEKKIHHEMEHLRTTLSEQLETIQATTQHMVQERVDALAQQNHDWQAHMEHLQHDLTRTHQQHAERIQKAFEELADTVRRQHEDLQRELTKQQKTFVEQQEALTQFVETHLEEIRGSLKRHRREREQDLVMWKERLEKMEQQSGQVATQVQEIQRRSEGYQRQITLQERQMQYFHKMLQTESQAHKVTTEHILRQQRRLQVLEREMERLKPKE